MQETCTASRVMRYLPRTWILPGVIGLYGVSGHSRRVFEPRNALGGITRVALAGCQRRLESEGVVTRRVDAPSLPVWTEFSLTSGGPEPVGVIRGIKSRELKRKIENPACGGRDCRTCPPRSEAACTIRNLVCGE